MKKTNLDNLANYLYNAQRKEDYDLKKWARGEISQGIKALERHYKKNLKIYFVQALQMQKVHFIFKVHVERSGKLVLSLTTTLGSICVYETLRSRAYVRMSTWPADAAERVIAILGTALCDLGVDRVEYTSVATFDQRTNTSVVRGSVSV